MNETNLSIDPKYVREKMKSLIKQGINVRFSAFFITDDKKEKVIDKADISLIKLINTNLKYESPDKVRIELFKSPKATQNLWCHEYILKEKQEPRAPSLGEAEINDIIDQKMNERIRSLEYDDLKDEVRELSAENKEQREYIDLLESENQNLKSELENKKTIRYYAGVVGDIFESLGLEKSKVGKALSGFVGMEDNKPGNKQLTEHHQDDSGIVEQQESPDELKRLELLELMSQYLNSLPLDLLADVFKIFSAVEENPPVSKDILKFLTSGNNEKTTSDE